MRLRSNRNTEEPYVVSGQYLRSSVQPRRAERKRAKRMAPVNRDEKSAKRKVRDLSAPTTSGCSSTALHHQQQQQSLHPPVNSDNSAQLVKRKINKSSRGKADKIQEGSVQEDISSIPDHILISIFTLLPIVDRIRIERVCRRWRHIAKNYSWTMTTEFSYSSLIGDKECSLPCLIERPVVGNKEIKSLAQRCGDHLLEMDLHAFRDTLTYNVCMCFAVHCPNLTVLNMYGIQLTNSSLKSLGRHCPNLEIVNFHRCFQESVVERGLTSFFSKCQNLREVDVGENERLTGLPSFTVLPRSIINLKIGGCFRLTAASLFAIRDRCPDLVALTMNSVDNISPTHLNSFFASLPKLELLKFGECYVSHTLGGIEINFSLMKNLTELTVYDNLLMTDEVLRNTVIGCKQLKYVDLSGCSRFVSNVGLRELAKLPYLSHLNLSYMRVVDDQTIRIIAEKSTLQTVLLHRCDEISDEAVKMLLKHCPFLTALDISFCPKVTDESMEGMISYVSKRQEREALLPTSSRGQTTPLTEVVTKMRRHERSLQALMDADFERHLMRFENFRYRFGNTSDYSTNPLYDIRHMGRYKPNPDGFTELHVWTAHSSITRPYPRTHPLLKVDDHDSIAEQSSSIFEFSVVIRIN
ncbi:F-box domain containing protein [Brugia malayi]|uniref:F-box domain containing protein n=1 Tax=Brugia malayi TaxID=6279 RepID=A0A4E9FBM4_BRUMA|nr:F-box domain containing protein [Brugia malayi]VIO93609.1 F-box domain containing protein [Brugia malayi]